MGWSKEVKRWLDDAALPFRYSIYAPADEDLLFKDAYTHFFDYLFRAASSCIVIDNLPETFYKPFFMQTLLLTGKICVFRRTNSELVALNCAQASEPDLYYVPKKILVVNPQFKGESYNLSPGVDCEVIYCTSQDMYRYGIETGGLYSLLSITARLMADNVVSLNVAQRNTRLTNALAADDDITKQSIETVLREMYSGRPYKVVQKTLIDKLENIPLQQTGTNQNLIQLLETHKYILSEFYAAIGLDEPQQMKRERLVTAEVEQGAELPLFNIYDIYASISEGIDRVNKMFETEITVSINPLIMAAFEDSSEADEDPDPTNNSEEGDLPEMVIQPDPSAAQQPPDIAADQEEEPEGTAGSSGSETEDQDPEDEQPAEEDAGIVVAAVEIIQTAAEIIDQVSGGDEDVRQESGDQSEAGEAREDTSERSAD